MTPFWGAPDTALLAAAAEAHARGDLAGALQLWSDYRSAHPQAAAGYLNACEVLRQAGRPAEAEAICAEALAVGSAPIPPVMAEHARIAEAAGPLEGALPRWLALEREYPNHPAGPANAARILLKLQRHEDAETLLTAAIARIPGNAALGRLLAMAAAARQDFALALQRWDAVLAAHPQDQGAINGRGATLWQARLAAGNAAGAEGEAAPAPPEGLVDVGRVSDPLAHDLVMGFESLGRNCEFGLVQRRFGAEPLGLLRWSFVEPPLLARLLETRLAGLGEPGQVSLRRSDWREWYIIDGVFGLSFHTFQSSDIADEAVYVKKQATRLRWLRDKLLDDLENGTKIFVYKPKPGTPDAHMQRIFAALEAFPKSRLLCIGIAGETASAGTVRPVADGHMWGYLSVHNPLTPGKWNICFDEWLSICRGALGA
jgi:tetratricopeptide (TPR) repeat protein